MHLRHLLALLLFGATLWAVTVPNSAEARSQGQDTAGQITSSRAKSWTCQDFIFTPFLPDPGGKQVGGWQTAESTLTIFDARHVIQESWNCDVRIGMPFRTSDGAISPGYAACIAADVANTAADQLIDRRSHWIRGLFCPKFNEEMMAVFIKKYPNVGGRVEKCQ